MVYSLIDYINAKTNNEFSFLKLVDIVFAQNKYTINYIYPESINLSDEEKLKIENLTKEFLKLNAEIIVKVKKSYLEVEILRKFVYNYILSTFPSMAYNIEKNSIKIDINSIVTITIECGQLVYDMFVNRHLDVDILKQLNIHFCGKFQIVLSLIKEEYDEEEFLKNRILKLEQLSNSNKSRKRRFDVEITHKLIGNPITVMPQAIGDFSKPALNVIFAGKIKFLTERKFTPKKPPKPGKEKEDKPMFTFTLEDRTGKVSAVVFPSKANYHKMQLLKDDDIIIIKGDLQQYNERLSLRVKDISYCQKITEHKNESKENISQLLSSYGKYLFVKPMPYIKMSQDNLFEVQEKISPKLINKTFVVFDLETTGLNADSDEIIEFGAVKIKDGKVTETFSCFVKPKNSIPTEATAINGITNDMVSDAYGINQVLPDFHLFCKDAILVAYNIPFDYGFINFAAKTMGLQFDNEQLDVLLIAKDRLPGLKNYKLATVCASVGVSLIGAHRAVNDAAATAELFIKIY